MSRLTIPEPEIELYKDGFKPHVTGKLHDQLGREPTGKALSDLVDRIAEPMVIALDGGWGSGKSFFLKCWVGEHLKREQNTTQTVYFDAFKHDFIDEPLISLMGVIEDRFEDEDVKDKTWKKRFAGTVSVAKRLLKPTLRIGAAVGTGMASEVAIAAIGTEKIDTVVDGAIDAGLKGIGAEASAAVDELWKSEAGRRQAMTEFRKSLIALTEPVKEKPAEAEDEAAKTPDEQKPRHRKLVIVVDELDRCRPDYALSLLELIKHFFDVPHVHFVLGVNMRELENSVKARYGGGINAGLYLQKFVTLTMGLPTTTNAFEGKSLSTSYFEKNSARVGINQAQHEYILGVLDTVIDKESLTLRAIQRLIALLQITTLPDMSFQDELLEKVAASSLSILRVIRPQTYKDIHTGKIDLVELQLIFEMSAEGHRRANRLLFDCWQLFLQPAEYTKRMGYTLDTAPSAEDQLKRIHQLKMRHLEVFELRGSL